MTRTILLLRTAGLIVCGTTCVAVAYPENYGPFTWEETPRPIRLESCRRLEATGAAGIGQAVTFCEPAGTNGVRVVLSPGKDRQSTLATLLGHDLAELCPTQDVAPWFFPAGQDALTGDLNGDRLPDFVVFLWSGGCGLAASCADVLFVLSSAQGYACSRLPTFDPAARDFVDLRGDGQCQFIQSTFIDGETGRDGKAHNYWVHSLYRIEEQRILPADSMDARFPCWIWYTDKPNHKPTTQLTADQKRRLWAAQGQTR